MTEENSAAGAAIKPGTAAEGVGVAQSGWFTELSTLWPGQGLSFEIKEQLFQDRSKFQDVAVFNTEAFGHVLVLDGVIQCTQKDEFSYQEMITHLPLCSLKRPATKALVVGGGDGGVLRELSRHASLQEIHIAEIDAMVPEVSKKYFPEMALGFDDPRVTVRITDGIDFVRTCEEGTYDAIIVDSSDPVGPAEVLFQRPFFEYMHRALKPGGVICTQAESLWLHMPIIKELAAMCNSVFQGGSVQYAYTTIPTYPSGQIGFMICAKAESDGSSPLDPRSSKQAMPGAPAHAAYPPVRYYNADVHRAAFVLPEFAKKELGPCLTFGCGM